jgi:hypothetical protein
LYQFLISIVTCPSFSNNVLWKVNSFSAPEGDCVEEDEMGRDCGTIGGEEIQGLGWKIFRL